MSCYTCTENLCKVTIDCDNKGIIKINQLAPSTGAYKIELNFLGKVIIAREFNFTEGQEMVFEMPFLNENYCYDFQVSLNGSILHFPIGDKLINTFNFCTKKEWTI
jgi:hypothetical protein